MDDESDHLLNQLKKLERRMEVLEGQLQNAIESYSRARYLARRIRIRPPIWNFEQYSPRRLAMPAVEQYLQTFNSEFRIAIVTPCYNSSAYLRAAIDSVLTQGYAKVSYLVQDGGSNDDTVSILREYGDRIRWRSERDDGQAQAINRGFAGVECDIMGYLNADDVLLPGTLKYVSHFFQTHPDVDFVYGHRVFIDCDGSEIGRAVLPKHDRQALKLAEYVPQETMFWRRQVFDAIGSFDEDFHMHLTGISFCGRKQPDSNSCACPGFWRAFGFTTRRRHRNCMTPAAAKCGCCVNGISDMYRPNPKFIVVSCLISPGNSFAIGCTNADS
jgi:hypothetical protein